MSLTSAVYVVWVLVSGGPEAWQPPLSLLALLMVALPGAWLLWHGASGPLRPNRQRLALGLLVCAAGQLVAFAMHPDRPAVGAVLGLPLLLSAVLGLRLTWQTPGRMETLSLALEALLLSAVLVMLAMHPDRALGAVGLGLGALLLLTTPQPVEGLPPLSQTLIGSALLLGLTAAFWTVTPMGASALDISMLWVLAAGLLSGAALLRPRPPALHQGAPSRGALLLSVLPHGLLAGLYVLDVVLLLPRGPVWPVALLTLLFVCRFLLVLLNQQRQLQLWTFRAEHDQLTGLLGRRGLEEHLRRAIAGAQLSGLPTAVLFLDLDRMKSINDTFGHPVGDAMLCEVARRLSASVPSSASAARYGGDEFVVVWPGLTSVAEVGPAVERLLSVLQQPVRVGLETLSLSASVGVAMCPDDADDSTLAIERADDAMYRAKQAGKGTWRFADDALNTALVMDLQIETHLRGALERGEFEVRYQPLMQLAEVQVFGFEALLSWHSPVLGRVSPGDFIPLAEARGTIGRLGRWVLREALGQMRRWRDQGWSDGCVSVNVSVLQFEAPDFVTDIQEALQEQGLPGEVLILEVTEGALIRDVPSSVHKLAQLRAMGVSIALDDFGTGYSSLSYLQQLPVNIIKIDRAFIRDLSERGTAFVQAIIALAHSLNLTVIAEGIEVNAQRDVLVALGCEAGQGYLFAWPMAESEVAVYLAGVDTAVET
ncbi:putative bifunctional diguanylate cyclase/phosphodiesterase [Deinococcus sonorensis]|uniref:EAL domain-containing protein n=2 Tax=Deinococcus sonorensis TaxID=309891 RepID=A0AAU7U571_9DEIO